MEHKLNGFNYLDLSKTIQIYVRSIRMEEDACLFLEICISTDSKVIRLINNYEFVKELVGHLEICIMRKGMSHKYFRYARLFINLKKGHVSYCPRKLMKS